MNPSTDNYTRLTDMLAGISCAPDRAAETDALKVIIDMLWQQIPIEKEKTFFGMLEIAEVECLAEDWYLDSRP
jgi:hypothetical protein